MLGLHAMKSLINVIPELINLIWQYRKAFSVNLKEKDSCVSLISRILKAHYKYGIGPLLYSYYQLDNVPESDWSKYIVDQKQFNQLLAGDSTVEDRRVAGNKLLFYQHCVKIGLPVIPVLCVISNEDYWHVDCAKIVTSVEEWQRLVPILPNELFIKPILGSSGIGSFAVFKEGSNFRFANWNGSIEDIFDYLLVRIKPGRGFVVQPRMKTHPALSGIVSPQGLSTIRIATLRRNGKSQIIMACFKLIRGDNMHDNFSKGMSNNLIAPINIETGELKPAWGSLMSDWPKMVQWIFHPDSGKKIEGFILPHWHEIAELALHAQESLPLLHTIGWDIALSDEGILIVEANTAYDAASFQLFEKRGLKSEFQKLFNS